MNIAILWFWLEGKSTYAFLTHKLNISPEEITILDEKKTIEIPVGSQAILWVNCYDSLVDFDIIWRSPGITDTILETKLTKSSEIEEISNKLTSQTQYFFDHYKGKIIGITGTKGKSTISTFTYLTLLDANMHVELVGNVGKPVLDCIDFDAPPKYVVYEMSSFMIESLKEFSVDIWVFSTLSSVHTKEHWWYDEYVKSKSRLISHSKISLVWHQAQDEFLSLGYNELIKNSIIYWARGYYHCNSWSFTIKDKIVAQDEHMKLLWEHNKHNICSIVWICDILWINIKHFIAVMNSFTWLEHRVEFVWTYWWINRYNDAIATAPPATIAALDTFKDEIDTLLYWGIDWEYDHSWVIERIERYGIKNLVLFPDTGQYIREWVGSSCTIIETRSMEEWVAFAKEHTKNWKIALLSCWSPSFSCWSSFKEKGSLFKQFIKWNE